MTNTRRVDLSHESRMAGVDRVLTAFLAEALKRKGRTFEQWSAAEIDAVHAAASSFAHDLGLRTPSREEIERVERLAAGHSDYSRKWALYAVEACLG